VARTLGPASTHDRTVSSAITDNRTSTANCASDPAMSTVAIAMKKGGVGKTTTPVTLAAIAAQRGLDVGLVDLDSQGTATSSVGIELSDNAADVLLGQMPLDTAWVHTDHGF